MKREAGKEEFLNLIQQNKGIIFKICNSYCHNKDDREDLAQEIIYQLWRSWHKFDPGYKFSTWMYRIALNVAITFYRKEKKSKDNIPITGHLVEIEESHDTSAEIEKNINLLQQF